MTGFLSAHGYEPGPTQRPLIAGLIAGLLATAPAILLLQLLGSLVVEARILGLTIVETIGAGWLLMAVAGGIYARLLGRAANDVRGGWLLGMAFGFALWAAGAVFILPVVGNGQLPAGRPAMGVFLSLILWGGFLGALLPLVHRRVHLSLDEPDIVESLGSSVATKRSLRRKRVSRPRRVIQTGCAQELRE